MIDRNLIDAHRDLHDNRKIFTWRILTPLQQGRLDFFLVSQSLNDFFDLRIG